VRRKVAVVLFMYCVYLPFFSRCWLPIFCVYSPLCHPFNKSTPSREEPERWIIGSPCYCSLITHLPTRAPAQPRGARALDRRREGAAGRAPRTGTSKEVNLVLESRKNSTAKYFLTQLHFLKQQLFSNYTS
jgi:hypothetical protein